MNENIVLGADIGGSHITASLVDIKNRQILAGTICRQEVDSGGSAEAIVGEWKKVLQNCLGHEWPIPGVAQSGIGHPFQQLRIGIAMPGPVDYEHGFCYIKGQNKYESLYSRNLKELLADALGINAGQIRMINDAAGFLSGEVFIGAGRDYKKVIGLTLGTGLGSALYDNGNTVDADLWHSPYLDGKAEDYISAPWLLASAEKATGQSFSNVKKMAEAAESNESIKHVFDEFGKHLADFLASMLTKENYDLVILGGNVAKAHPLFRWSMTERLERHQLRVPVRVAEIGEVAALVGAAALWENNLPVREPAVLQ